MNDFQRRIFRTCQDVTTILAQPDNPATPIHRLALAGGLAREEAESYCLKADVLDGKGDYTLGYLLPEKARDVAYRRALLDEYVPCWDAPVPFPCTAPGNRHAWELSPESTPQERERGYRRYICGRCHRHGEEDSTG